MTDRDRLIGIMTAKPFAYSPVSAGKLADHLIANGVTVSEGALPVAEAATERSAAVDKIEDKRKPEDFIGHRKPEQEWIPVTERLPDADGNYIVTACDEGCSYGEGIWYDTVVVVAEYYKGSWTWNENGTEYDLCGIVTHWMPLPAPPKGD